jgi:hypothetical protein
VANRVVSSRVELNRSGKVNARARRSKGAKLWFDPRTLEAAGVDSQGGMIRWQIIGFDRGWIVRDIVLLAMHLEKAAK